MSEPLLVVATPIGNLGDLSARAAEALCAADIVACEDTRRTATLLRHAGSTAKMLATHQHNEAGRAEALVARAQEGQRIVLVSDAGMPSISDPGQRVVAAFRAAGLDVSVVPGPSAVQAALVASGFPVEAYLFVGFFPRKASEREELLDRADASRATVVGFESPKRVGSLLAALAARAPERPVAVCRELTKLHEEVILGTSAELAVRLNGDLRGEVTVVLHPLPATEATVDGLAQAAAVAAGAGIGPGPAADLIAALGPWSRNEAYAAVLAARVSSKVTDSASAG